MNQRFKGKVCIVTGGGGEIGLATARRLAEEGAAIALVDVKGLERSQTELEKITQVSSHICDVSDYAQVEACVALIRKDHGHIDMLFNNAGIQGAFSPIHTYPVEDFHKVIEINLVGAFHVLRAVSAVMVDQGGGVIVNTASMAGVAGPVNMAAYGASKWAIVGMTKTAAKDLAPYNIRVNSISPGFMGPGFMWERQVELQAQAGSQYYSSDPDTVSQQMIGEVPMRRYGSIDEIPGSVAYLMSEDSSYSTGINIQISGGI